MTKRSSASQSPAPAPFRPDLLMLEDRNLPGSLLGDFLLYPPPMCEILFRLAARDGALPPATQAPAASKGLPPSSGALDGLTESGKGLTLVFTAESPATKTAGPQAIPTTVALANGPAHGPLSTLDLDLLTVLSRAASQAPTPSVPGLHLLPEGGALAGGGGGPAPVAPPPVSGGGGGGGGGTVAGPLANAGTAPGGSATPAKATATATPVAHTAAPVQPAGVQSGHRVTGTPTAQPLSSPSTGNHTNIRPALPQPTGQLTAVDDNADNRNYYTIPAGGTLNVDFEDGVQENDQYIASGDSLVSTITGAIPAGLNLFPDGLNLEPDGRFSYSAPAGFHGTVTFKYFDSEYYPDGKLRAVSNIATVSISVSIVTAVAPAPLVASPPPAVSPWPTFHGDLGHTGAGATAVIPPGITGDIEVGVALDGSPTIAAPAGADPSLFISDSGGQLHSYDLATGSQNWTGQLGTGASQFGQALSLGLDTAGALHVYASSVGGYFYDINAVTGLYNWRFTVPAPAKFYASALVVSGTLPGGATPFSRVVVGSDESWATEHPGGGPSLGSVRGFNSNGTVNWQTLLPGRVIYAAAAGPPLPGYASTVVVGTDAGTGETTGHLFLLNAINGMVLAQEAVTGAVTCAPAVDPASGVIYFAHNYSLEGVGVVVDPSGSFTFAGVPGFPVQVTSYVHSTPAIDPGTGTIYFGDDGGALHAISPAGDVVFVYNPVGGGAIKNAPLLTSGDGDIYFGTAGPNAAYYGLTPGGGLVLFQQGGLYYGTSSAALGPGGVQYIGSGDGTLAEF